MMAEKRRTYTAACKREAVRLVTDHGYTLSEAARNLELNINRLRRGKQACEAHQGGAFPGHGRLTPEQEALGQLRAENTRLRMERDMVTKATVFFASESSCNMP